LEISPPPLESTLLEQLDVAKKVRIHNIPESIAQTQMIITEVKELQLLNVLANAQNLMGLLLMIVGNFEESNQYSNQALANFMLNNDKKGITDATFNMASTCYKTDDFYQGLLLMFECLQIYGTLHDFSNKARVHKSIGTIYEYLGDTNRAIENYQNCIADAQKADEPNSEPNAYNSLSGTYLKPDKIELAKELAQKSITIKQATNDIRGFGIFDLCQRKSALKIQ